VKAAILMPLVLIICTFSSVSWLSVNQDLEISQVQAASYYTELAEANHQLESANTKLSDLEYEVSTLEDRFKEGKDNIADLEARNKELLELNYDLRQKNQSREFKDVAELREYVVNYKHSFTGALPLSGQNNACVMLATAMVKDARKNGYLMSTEIVNGGWHMICSTMIGREIWFIEPATKEFWLAYD